MRAALTKRRALATEMVEALLLVRTRNPFAPVLL